jgi:hypothetical protein
VSNLLSRTGSRIISLLSGEWILTQVRLGNGGDVVFYRALWTSAWMFGLAVGLHNLVDPSKLWSFSIEQLQLDVLERFPWFGAIFAGAYAAYYARFSSQWNYLANLYNQIKAAEVGGVANAAALAQWKAGFVEDAEDLHLATKSMFANVVHAWGSQPDVGAEFRGFVVGKEPRLDRLMSRVSEVLAAAERRY